MHFRNPILIALTALLTACGSCGSNDDAVALARSLSQARLAQLFREVQSLRPAADLGRTHIDIRAGMPDTFKYLDPQSITITIDARTARVHLSGCADDKVLLVVKGIGNNDRKKIVLLPGESKDASVLWQSD